MLDVDYMELAKWRVVTCSD